MRLRHKDGTTVHLGYCTNVHPGEELPEIDEQIEWKIVRTVSTEIEARLMAGRLRSEGIPAFVLSQVDSTRNFTVGALAVAKVFVPEQLLDQSKRILSRPAEGDGDEGGGMSL